MNTLVLADQVGDGALMLAIGVAFVAGLVSFLSPCVLPLVPAYLSFVTGLSAADLAGTDRPAEGAVEGTDEDGGRSGRDGPAPPPGVRRRVVLGAVGFVLGAAVVFVSFGALFGSLGQALRTHAVGLSQVFGVVTIVLGLLVAGVLDRIPFLQREVRIHSVPGRGLAAAPVLGFTFALGWTPCIGPTLATVLGLSASNEGATAARGALLSVAYCLGLGVPLLLAGLAFTRALSLFALVRRHQRTVMVVGGVGLVLLGVLQVTGVWTDVTDGLQTRFGGWDLPL